MKESLLLKDYAFIKIGLCSFLIYCVLVYIDAFELLAEWFSRYEKYELDELFLILPVYAFGLSVFVLIRQKKMTRLIQELRHEITHRKLIENKLNEKECLLSNHLENTPIGTVVWDLKFIITEWNPAAEKIFGYKNSEAIGKNMIKLLFKKDSHKVGDEIINDLLNTAGGVKMVTKNMTKTGTLISCHWSNTLFRNKYGVMLGVASLIVDISKKMKPKP